jgi:hypothetical protein
MQSSLRGMKIGGNDAGECSAHGQSDVGEGSDLGELRRL